MLKMHHEKIKIIKFDLIILDIMMPGKSGLEFIEENKKKITNSNYFINCKRSSQMKELKD